MSRPRPSIPRDLRIAPALLVSCVLISAGCQGYVDPGPARGRGVVVGPPGALAPGPAVFPRLTASQYTTSVIDALGPGLPRVALEQDTNPYLFFSIGAASTSLSELGAQQYEEAAHRIARTVLEDPARREALVGCTPASADDACARAFLERIGTRLFRRPLETEEVDRWALVAAELSEGDAWRGLRFALAGMLQSPRFLYRVELGEPDPERPGELRYSDLEMASRLSFLLWNSPPDQALLEAALAGELGTPEGVREHATRMIEDPRARRAVQAFFAQYLDLARLEGLEGQRDPALYPAMSDTLARSMRTEIELLVDDLVFRRDADVRELFRTRRTFVNDELAALYGVEAEGASPIAFVPVELPADGARAGVLTLGAFLAMNAHPTETSPTLRGKYVRERVLCELVPPPPPEVDTTLAPDPGMPRTLRERLELHRSEAVCAACHAAIDPPGFLFEGFDSIGAERTHDNGYPVDTSGELDGTPLTRARDLGELIAEDPRVSTCMVRQLYRHAAGRLEVRGEEAAILELEQRFAASGHRFVDLLIELASSDVYRRVRAVDTAEVTP